MAGLVDPWSLSGVRATAGAGRLPPRWSHANAVPMKSADVTTRRWRLTWVIALAGVLASVSVARVLQNREIRLGEAEFRLRAEERLVAIEHEFTAVNMVVEALAALFDSSNEIGRSQFRAFTAPLLARLSSIQALSFNRRVTEAERLRYEEDYRTAEVPDYQITQRAVGGGVERASDRPEHVVVQYIEPYVGNERALGSDLAAERVRREALARARDTGATATTGRISLVQADDDPVGVLVAHPAYRTGAPIDTLDDRRRNLVGYAVAVYRIDEAVRLAQGRLGSEGIELRLIDLGAEPGPERLSPVAQDGSPATGRGVSGFFQPPPPTVYGRFVVGGRTWVTVASPSAKQWRTRSRTTGAAAVLFAGLLITGLVVGYVARQEKMNSALRAEIADRARAEEESRRSESRYRHVVEDQTDLIVRWHADGLRSFVSQAYCEHFGLTQDECLGSSIFSVVHEEDLSEVKQRLGRLSAENQVSTGTHRVVLSDGRVRWQQWTDRAILDDGGEIKEFQSVGRDITEQKEAEARQALLTSELDHRVKNTLATVLALAAETGAHSNSVPGFQDAFSGRLQSMARAHEALARNMWNGVDLDELARVTLEPSGEGGAARVVVEAASIRLPARSVQPVAVLLNELMTNALKHGALSAAAGKVHLRCEPTADEGVDLEWVESGGPPPTAPGNHGLGLSLVSDLIEQELGGSIELGFPRSGFRCRIHIDLSLDAPHETPPAAPTPRIERDDLDDARSLMRILVVEDDHLQSRRMVQLLTELGCEVVGPIGRLDAALRAARDSCLDGAVLDVDLRGESSIAVASLLADRGCPFVFVTGFAHLDGLPGFLSRVSHLTKPVSRYDLETTIRAFRAV